MLSFMYSCSILITKSSCQSIKILDHTFSYNSFSFVAYLILLKNLQWNWVMKSFHIFCKLFTRWSDFMVGCFLQHTYTHTQTHTILTFLLTPISVRRPKSQFFNQVIIFLEHRGALGSILETITLIWQQQQQQKSKKTSDEHSQALCQRQTTCVAHVRMNICLRICAQTKLATIVLWLFHIEYLCNTMRRQHSPALPSTIGEVAKACGAYTNAWMPV